MDDLHLLRVPLRPERLAAMAKQMGIPLRDLDEGYLCHYVTRGLWQDNAPAPFLLRPAGRTLDVWGYSLVDAPALVEHARAFGDPALLETVADLDAVASRPVPELSTGRVLGFALRACPVARLSRGTNGHRRGAELDAFLVRCFSAGPDAPVSREDVYREWLVARLNAQRAGVEPGLIRIAAVSRERLVRRSQGPDRRAGRLERPDVRFDGTITVTDPDWFRDALRHGIGRHRAFGFGALMLIPAGSSYPR